MSVRDIIKLVVIVPGFTVVVTGALALAAFIFTHVWPAVALPIATWRFPDG